MVVLVLVVRKLWDAGGDENVNAFPIVGGRARRRQDNFIVLIVVNAKAKKESFGVKFAVGVTTFVSND